MSWRYTVVGLALLGCGGDDTGGADASGGGTGEPTASSTTLSSTDTSMGSGGSSSMGSATQTDTGTQSTTEPTDTTTDATTAADGSSTADESDDTSGSGDSSSTGDSDSGGAACVDPDDCTGETIWSRAYGPPSSSSREYIRKLAVDLDGFVYVAGTAQEAFEFGDTTICDAGPICVFVLKVDPQGEPVWAHDASAELGFEVHGMGISDAGHPTVVGYIRGDFDLGEGAVDSDTSWDPYLIALHTNGTVRFTRHFATSGSTTGFRDIAVQPDGSYAVVGGLAGNTNLGGNQLNSGTASHGMAARYDASGGHIWSRRFGDSAGARCHSVAFDAQDNVVVACRNYGTLDFGGMPHTATAPSAMVIAKLAAADGDRIWSHQFEDEVNEVLGTPRLASSDDQIFMATYNDSADVATVDFGLGAITGNMFLVAFDQSGIAQWNFEIPMLRGMSDLQVDEYGSVVFAGALQGAGDYGETPLASFMSSYDMLVAKHDTATGDVQWVRVIGDYDQQSRQQHGTTIGVDPSGTIYAGGYFEGQVHSGDQIHTAGGGLGGSDGLLIKMEP